MDISTANVLSVVIPLLAVAATWGGVSSRIGRLEKDVEAITSKLDAKLESLTSKVDEKLRDFQHARERQGERIGDVEWETARLGERVGMTVTVGKRRKLTKPGGEPIG